MPRKSTKNKDSVSAAQRRRSGRVAGPLPPVASISTTVSASPSPSLTSPSVPVANPKNIDDINWRHPAELTQIFPEKNTQADLIPILQSQAYSVPGQPTDPKELFCEITLAVDGSKVIVPVGYRVPLMFCAKYLWESVRLVLTSDDPSPEEEWQNYKFDLVNLSRLCFMFLQSARTGMIKKRKGGLNVRWRNGMFDRVLTRYWWGWMVNREEFIRAFWMEFKEEEYERDVCRRDWKTMTLKGHNGFYLTPSEQQNGITAEQFTAGLTPIYSSPTPSPSPTTLSRSLPSPQPQAQPRIITSYKWDNTTYALANELVVTGTHISSDPVHVALRREEKEWGEDGWEGEGGRKRKRMKMNVNVKTEPGEEEEMGVVMRELGLGGEVGGEVIVVEDVGGEVEGGEVQVPQTPIPPRGLPTPPPTGPQRILPSVHLSTPESSFIISPLSPSPQPSLSGADVRLVDTQKMKSTHAAIYKESTSGESIHGDEECDTTLPLTPAPSSTQISEVAEASTIDTTLFSTAVQLDRLNKDTPIGSIPAVEPQSPSVVESHPSSAPDGLESCTDNGSVPIANSSPPSQVEQHPDQPMDIDITSVHDAPPTPPFAMWPVAVDGGSANAVQTVITDAGASLPSTPNIFDQASVAPGPAESSKVSQIPANDSIHDDISTSTDPTCISLVASTSTLTSQNASSLKPEVITQVLDIVPSMLSQLHSLLDVASFENTLPSSSENNEAAIEKIRSTSLDKLVLRLIERMNALESEVKFNQEELKRSQEENERTTHQVLELEARLKACESHSSEPLITPNHVHNGISAMGTSSIDESIPLPIKSQRKQMNLIAMSPSRPPSTDRDGLV
ncbi:hypothetical protein BDQ17DRAFT_1371273 [Cyathus striatus]|nr:hypothetical protein BDQ17DRAFT_1371273 [Cyathus striatus]